MQRLQLEHVDRRPCLQLLQQLQEQHLRCIPFENIDVVLGQSVSMASSDVQVKLLGRRGGYCFEQNTLMADALQMLGFTVQPLLARVRWNKAADVATAFTHMVLRVQCPQDSETDASRNSVLSYLVDVAFGGIGPLSPLVLGQGPKVQTDTEGCNYVVKEEELYTTVSWITTKSAESHAQPLDLYMFKNESALQVDLMMSNWWSCTHPSARFVSSFFVAKVVGDERHHILNGSYVIRRRDGSSSSECIGSSGSSTMSCDGNRRLQELLVDVFGIVVPDVPALYRYLHL